MDLASSQAVDTVAAELLATGPVMALVHAAGVLRTAPLGALVDRISPNRTAARSAGSVRGGL